ncbi:TPA: DUF2514 family protein [Escherichia coli]|nr:DUF2514 family protein [Escherichia coli]HAG7673996.1 DUF2514 family protein [Escherichia coli]
MVTHEFFLLITNAVICTGIAIRVVTFRRNGSQHRRWGGWLAYFLIVAAASIPVRVVYAIWLRTPMAVDLSEVIINAVMLAAVIKTMAMLAVLVISGVVAWNAHGSRQYDAGYAQAQEDQKQADDKARSQRDQEKTQIEREAQSRIDVARVDAEHANAAADSLRAELDKTKRLAEHYTGSFPTGTPASKVIGVLADMLEESNRVYNATAAEAEKYRIAGESCEQQYDSLKKQKSWH